MLANKLGVRSVRLINAAESFALQIAQDWAIEQFDSSHRFATVDLLALHRQWLGAIYPWAGEFRSVNLGKGGFQFATAALVPGLMGDFERGPLTAYTPCIQEDVGAIALALAVVHAEFILIHPFREGNGRAARLLALLMGYQAGLPALDFSPLGGRGKPAYIAAIHAAMGRNYAPLAILFKRVIGRALRSAS